MPSSILISLDGMGGDHGPPVVIAGIRDYRKQHGGEGVRFLVHGDEAAIRAEMTKCGLGDDLIVVRHTVKVVGMEEKPALAMRRGKGSSRMSASNASSDARSSDLAIFARSAASGSSRRSRPAPAWLRRTGTL